MFTAIAIVVSLIIGAALGRASVDTKPPAVTPNLDSARLTHLETTKQTTLYNPEHEAWAIVSASGTLMRADRTLRGAIDKAREQPNG